ncbi:MAG: protein TolQ [Desulfobulbaceae bacterium]
MNMSLVQMMLHAGLMVKTVMVLLFLFSIGSWSIIIMKQMLFSRARRSSEEFLEQFWASKTLNEAYESAANFSRSPEAAVFVSGFNELRKIGAGSEAAAGETLQARLATLDNVKRAMRKAGVMEIERLGRSLPFLATTGSATPFIGLFGTVWGIMTSFHDIGMRGSASLAVVAPGISEALVATAAGLAVAIPAVIFYNFYSNRLAEFEADIEYFSTDFLNLIERDFLTRP